EPAEAKHRRHVDDGSAAALLHARHGGPGAKKSAIQIDPHRLLPEVIGHVEQPLGAADTGGVDKDVELSKAIDDRSDDLRPRVLAHDVELLIKNVMAARGH